MSAPKLGSEPLNQGMVELVSRIVHNSTVRVLLVVAVYVQHQAKLLNGRAQVNRLGLAAAKLESDVVAFTVGEVQV